MKDKIHHILERIPEKSHLIELLMEKDPEFVSMCTDYNDCMNALRYWRRSKAPEAETRVQEYRELIKELEDEINMFLSTNPSDRQD